MGNFDDTNVDKNLLSQIFADDDDDIMNGLLEENPEELYEKTEKQTTDTTENDKTEDNKDVDDNQKEDVKKPEEDETDTSYISGDNEEKMLQEKTSAENDKAVEKDAGSFSEENQNKETEKNNVSNDCKKSGVEDDIVRKEALKSLEIERINGTITVITEKTTINSGISSDGSLEVMGTIAGDIDCQGKVYISGTVLGSITASEIYVNTPRLTGGLLSESKIKIGAGTIIIGDVTGTSAYIAGAVKGNVDIDGPVILDSTAIVKGDIKAKAIRINGGAIVDGYCSLDYAGIDLESYFI